MLLNTKWVLGVFYMDEEKLNSNNSNFKMTTEEAIRLIDIIKERISE